MRVLTSQPLWPGLASSGLPKCYPPAVRNCPLVLKFNETPALISGPSVLCGLRFCQLSSCSERFISRIQGSQDFKSQVLPLLNKTSQFIFYL